MQILISNDQTKLNINDKLTRTLEKILNTTSELYALEECEVSVSLVDNENIQALNKQYRQIDNPTDVLSFALNEMGSGETELVDDPSETILGDIVISVEKAQEQAEEYGHSFDREMSYLLIHGMLHLLGYDHMDEVEKAEMRVEEEAILQKLGIGRDKKVAPLAPEEMRVKDFKSGFVAIIGRPNVGKSTLVNNLIGQKVAIMSDKPQTTRNKILCVLTREDSQIVFMDTPGIHKPHHKLGEFMVKVAESTLNEVDVILFVVDVNEKIGMGENYILEKLAAVKTPVLLILNKIDKLADKAQLLPIITSYTAKYNFVGVLPISALADSNFDLVITEINKHLEFGPAYFPADTITDRPERFVVAEMIREKVLLSTRDEIPHSVAIEIEEMKVRSNNNVYVRAVIYVERDSQKGIIVGAKGALLKDIGQMARADIEPLLGNKVYLDLWVKVKKDWRNKDGALSEFGYQVKK